MGRITAFRWRVDEITLSQSIAYLTYIELGNDGSRLANAEIEPRCDHGGGEEQPEGH